jgi:hypothetical protein
MQLQSDAAMTPAGAQNSCLPCDTNSKSLPYCKAPSIDADGELLPDDQATFLPILCAQNSISS